nr:unnamed protein product [Digitaria exilis]
MDERAWNWRSTKNYLLRAAAVAGDTVEEGPIDARDVVDQRRELEPQHRGRRRRRLPAGPEGGRGLLLRVLCLRTHTEGPSELTPVSLRWPSPRREEEETVAGAGDVGAGLGPCREQMGLQASKGRASSAPFYRR